MIEKVLDFYPDKLTDISVFLNGNYCGESEVRGLKSYIYSLAEGYNILDIQISSMYLEINIITDRTKFSRW